MPSTRNGGAKLRFFLLPPKVCRLFFYSFSFRFSLFDAYTGSYHIYNKEDVHEQ